MRRKDREVADLEANLPFWNSAPSAALPSTTRHPACRTLFR